MNEFNSRIKLLDCTLRDGGHDIDSRFGRNVICNLIEKLTMAKTDIIEIGFLKKQEFNSDVAVFGEINQAKELVKNYRDYRGEFALLAQQDQYDVNLLPQNDGIINCIRVSFHINDYMEGLEFCKRAKLKGYKVYCNPINIMGYSDEHLLELIRKVNIVEPHTFTIVDTFGSMQYEDLRRITYILLNNLKENINLAIHLHENMSLSYSLAQEILRFNLNGRELTIDASLRGMGRIPGNLPVELIADYLNRNFSKNYDLDAIYDAIENDINFFYKKLQWGYDPIYSLSGQYNLHRTYAEYLKNTGKLGAKDIKKILNDIPEEKRVLYDASYIEAAYLKYMNVECDDCEDIKILKSIFFGKDVLLLGAGRSILSEKETVNGFIQSHNDAKVVSVNYYSDLYNCDYAFFSNIKRYGNSINKMPEKTIITSNLSRIAAGGEMIVAYDKLCVDTNIVQERDNSLFMVLNLLVRLNAEKIYLIGFDGYMNTGEDYYISAYDNFDQPNTINSDISKILYSSFNMDTQIHFVTHSLYEYK